MRNRYWSGARPDWMPHPEIPEIFPVCASMVGWMTDQRFKHEVFPSAIPFSPYNDELYTVAQDLETVMEATWHVNMEEQEVTTMLWDAQIYGTGVLKTVWDNTLHGGIGDAIQKRIDPFTFYPDPAARGMADANYFCEARKVSLQELDRKFPGAAKWFVEGGADEVDQAPDQVDPYTTAPKTNPGALTGTGTAGGAGRYGRPGGAQISVQDHPGVTLIECWIREHELYEADVTDSKGDTHTDVRIYDTWRCIIIAGNRVLMNEPADELWNHGQHPYDRYVPYDLGEFWGLALVEMLGSAQESINRILAAMQMNVELTGNPILIETARAGIARTQITNKPGQRLNPQRGKEDIGWLNPPGLHQAMPELLRYYLGRMEAVSGLSAITKGSQPGGRNSQGVMDALQESSFVRVRMALRNLEFTLRGSGYKKASLIAEFYDTPRTVAIVGNDGARSSLFLRHRHFYLPHGQEHPLKFTLLVNAGSEQHTGRKMREDKYIMLFTMGAIDEIALLEALEVPNRQAIAARVREMKAAGTMEPPGARQRAQRTS